MYSSAPPYALVERLLAAGSDAVGDDGSGYTLLHRVVAEHMDARLLHQLVAAGADPAAVDQDGFTVLMVAVRQSSAEVVEALLGHKVPQEATLFAHAEHGEEDRQGFTALHVAAQTAADVTDILKLLIDHGADVTARDAQGRGVLHLADGDNLSWLLAHTDLSLEAADYGGRTPLMVGRSIEAVKALLQAGADLHAQNPFNGFTALTEAVVDNQPDIFQALLEAGADLYHRDQAGRIPSDQPDLHPEMRALVLQRQLEAQTPLPAAPARLRF